MFVLGITGGIGCGKSTFADFFRQAGISVIDADVLSHTVTDKGGSALAELQTILPEHCFFEDGSLDRQAVGELVFKEKYLLDQLTLTVHQHVIENICKAVDKAKADKCKLLVLDVPLPVKHGFLDLVDFVVLVWADLEKRLERLEQRGLNRSQAKLRINSQMSKEEYEKLANLTVDNSGTLSELEQAFKDFVKQELEARGIFLS